MPKFHVSVPVEAVSGFQTFLVEAESEDAAADEWLKNSGEFVEEEIEVTSLGKEASGFVVQRADEA